MTGGAFRALAWSHLRREPGRSLLTVLGVALGIAVLVAVELATESSLQSFRSAVDDVAGRATLTIRGNAAPLPGTVVQTIISEPGVRSVAPLIEGRVDLTANDKTTEMTLFGVDLLGSGEEENEAIREFSFRLADGVDFSQLLIDPGQLILTEEFAGREGIALGDPIQILAPAHTIDAHVAALVDAGAVGSSFDGNLIVTDLGNADWLFGRRGVLDRVDLTLSENASERSVVAALKDKLGPAVLVETPEARGERATDMIAAFRFNLRALGHIAVLVGAFLIFNSISIAVVRRRSEIGTLRAVGVKQGSIRRVFLLEGLAFGIAGTAVGIVLGVLMAGGMLGTVNEAVSINFFESRADSLALSPGILIQTIILGIVISLAASLVPAAQAARTPAANTMRRGTDERSRAASLPLWIGGLFFAATGVALLLIRDPRPGLPITGYGASVLIIIGMTIWARPISELTARALQKIYAPVFGAEGLLAVMGVRASAGRATVAVCGLMISVAMVVSVGVMISGFRGTVVDWMNQVLRADLYISAGDPSGERRGNSLPAEFADAVANIEGVSAIDPFRTQQIEINGVQAVLGAGDLNVVRFANEDTQGEPLTDVMRRAAREGQVVVSEVLARKLAVAKGEMITLPTPQGERDFTVAGVYYDYSSVKGYVIMDREQYLTLYGDRAVDSVSVYLNEGADRAAIREQVLAAAGGLDIRALQVRANRELREAALIAFDQTFKVTWLLQLIAVVVAALGVATTLLAQILDRRDELATLRHLGVSRSSVRRIITLEASVLAAIGLPLGVGGGIVLSWILTNHIMVESFGWTIGFAVPWMLVISMSLVILVSSLAAGYFSARFGIDDGALRKAAVG